MEGVEGLAVSTSESILRGGGVVEALAVAGAVSEHPCEGVTRGAKMFWFLFMCLTSPPSSSISLLSTSDFHAVALCFDVRLSRFPPSPPPDGAEISRRGSGGPPLTSHGLPLVVTYVG